MGFTNHTVSVGNSSLGSVPELTSSNYHLYGDVKLNGPPKSGTTLTIKNSSTGEVIYTGTYGAQEQNTTVGKFRVVDKMVNSAIVADYVHFYFDVPAESYTITAANGSEQCVN